MFSLAAISVTMFSLAAISAHFEVFGSIWGNSEESVPQGLAGITHETLEVTPEVMHHSIWIYFTALLNFVFYFCGCELLAFFFLRSLPNIQVSESNGDTQQMFNSRSDVSLLRECPCRKGAATSCS